MLNICGMYLVGYSRCSKHHEGRLGPESEVNRTNSEIRDMKSYLLHVSLVSSKGELYTSRAFQYIETVNRPPIIRTSTTQIQ